MDPRDTVRSPLEVLLDPSQQMTQAGAVLFDRRFLRKTQALPFFPSVDQLDDIDLTQNRGGYGGEQFVQTLLLGLAGVTVILYGVCGRWIHRNEQLDEHHDD